MDLAGRSEDAKSDPPKDDKRDAEQEDTQKSKTGDSIGVDTEEKNKELGGQVDLQSANASPSTAD